MVVTANNFVSLKCKGESRLNKQTTNVQFGAKRSNRKLSVIAKACDRREIEIGKESSTKKGLTLHWSTGKIVWRVKSHLAKLSLWERERSKELTTWRRHLEKYLLLLWFKTASKTWQCYPNYIPNTWSLLGMAEVIKGSVCYRKCFLGYQLGGCKATP